MPGQSFKSRPVFLGCLKFRLKLSLRHRLLPAVYWALMMFVFIRDLAEVSDSNYPQCLMKPEKVISLFRDSAIMHYLTWIQGSLVVRNGECMEKGGK